ncbi:23S rRNA (adenine(2030)-N(6))-methyltransferase RlmJ [Pseudidiomarina insulisalsae]|uniref:Ribosomal RNA large subunit methyltransferase J n=1 Tax=Pseudidiomarina insulisalsae TaxID=575789 RepID=A0A432YQJ6_9GAMM|nr:23S rRNA (adenine(2030)-N(6))-methyltransferase RlmJ [Pseudidiomarina insulisalsae]RUO63529.1 23S rRNA (adenine(2030)-N(6))-methyltransferase RlmJ [Pseudidiomarina insulisalsae]
MNYRHSYHAGNFADVMKHALQWACLAYLQEKDKPFWLLDTHAGIGMYDLLGEQASKTGEWQSGIARLLAAPEAPQELQGYLQAVRHLNADDALRWYPGSPYLAALQLRAQDQLTLCELHPEDARALAQNVSRDFPSRGQVKVELGRNGYAALKALTPPPIKRGMVLIDPPFEQRDEFSQVVQALGAGTKRWATGSYVIWYPIKDPLIIGDFHQQVADLPHVSKAYAVDLLVRGPQDATRMNGCGMLFVNPPYGVVQQVATIMNFITPLLAQDRGAEWQERWLKSA